MLLKPALGINIKDYGPAILRGRIWRTSAKIDGVRRLFHKNSNGLVTCLSRTGKPDTWLTHIFEYLEAPWFPYDTVYDCELVDRKLYFDKVDSYLLRVETTSKAAQQFYDNKKDLIAICFDMFEFGGDLRTGEERTELLKKTFSGTSPDEPMIMVPIYENLVGDDMDKLDSLMKQIVKEKGEGLMLMDLNSPYISGRSKNLIKVKRMEEFIGEIIDVEMAKDGTKIEGGIAAIICKVDGCTVPVRVGTGFTNEERQTYMNMDIIGMTVEIDAFGKTLNKDGGVSLSLPVFKDLIPFR